MIRTPILLALALSLSLAFFPAHAVAGYTPRQGDTFSYYEVTDLGSGTGGYTGYTEHAVVNGIERENNVYPNGTVAANYTYTWNWSNSSGSTQSQKPSGNFTWSSTTFHYVKRTDNQTGYVNPFVWFYMDNRTGQSGSFYLLNTQMTVMSTSANYQLPSQNRYVKAIFAEGTSSYQRNDVYGIFTATYTWDTYFDPLTGYIIGYSYTEHDNNAGAGFTYTENLYVTTTSYPLTTGTGPGFLQQYLGLIVGLVIFIIFIIIVIVVIYAVAKSRRSLPKHPFSSERPPPTIDLTPKQQPPVQQIVIKEVVKVKCKYCGALIDSTVQACPFCGAPRT